MVTKEEQRQYVKYRQKLSCPVIKSARWTKKKVT